MVKRNTKDIIQDMITEVKKGDNETLKEEMEWLPERIDLCMLMSAHVGDVSLVTVNDIYKKEPKYIIPIIDTEYGKVGDTEVVYNSMDYICSEIGKDD